MVFAKGRFGTTTAVALPFEITTALAVRLPGLSGAAPQSLQLTSHLVTIVAPVIVGLRTKRASGATCGSRFAV